MTERHVFADMAQLSHDKSAADDRLHESRMEILSLRAERDRLAALERIIPAGERGFGRASTDLERVAWLAAVRASWVAIAQAKGEKV